MRLKTLSLIPVLLLPACTGQTQAPAPESANIDRESAPNDPGEETNRRIFRFNVAADHAVMQPVATAYQVHVPDAVRQGVHNFAANIGEPKVLVNDVLQGNGRRALTTAGRFLLNTTVGIVGLFDVADRIGLPRHDADFGQTFGVWGIAPGPVVQIPLLGTSSVRDSAGSVIGLVANPLLLIPGGPAVAITGAGSGGGAVDGRASVLDASNDLEKHSLDYYAVLRSINAQRRAAMVEEGRAGLVRIPQP